MILSSQPPNGHRSLVRSAGSGRREGQMSKPIERISINTGGGDAPGLNAVIYAVVHAAAKVGWQVFGIREGYNGLLYPEQYPDGGLIELDIEKVKNIAHLGGTILGTTNRGNPFRAVERSADGSTREVDRSSRSDRSVPKAQTRRARGGRRRRQPDDRSAASQERAAGRRCTQNDRQRSYGDHFDLRILVGCLVRDRMYRPAAHDGAGSQPHSGGGSDGPVCRMDCAA